MSSFRWFFLQLCIRPFWSTSRDCSWSLDVPSIYKRLFADDCLLYRTIATEEDAIQLQRDLDHIQEWAAKWQLRFNVRKCTKMRFTRSFSIKLSINISLFQFHHISPQWKDPPDSITLPVLFYQTHILFHTKKVTTHVQSEIGITYHLIYMKVQTLTLFQLDCTHCIYLNFVIT